jgi:hypothetical protein
MERRNLERRFNVFAPLRFLFFAPLREIFSWQSHTDRFRAADVDMDPQPMREDDR